MYYLRIYSITNPEAAKQYFEVHWARHVRSLEKFSIRTENVWCEKKEGGTTRVFAICSYPKDANVDELDKAFMDSQDFIEDMKGFDTATMLGGDVIPLSMPLISR